MRTLLYSLLASGLLLGGAALAQDRDTQSPPQNQQLRPQAPDGSSGSSTPGSGSGSLSNQLNRSSGVLQPPPTSDRGVVRPPSAGTQDMPVIPPPGSPGGNQQVQPK